MLDFNIMKERCENYFNPFNSPFQSTNYHRLDKVRDYGMVALKIVSYVTVIIPGIVALFYAYSCAKLRERVATITPPVANKVQQAVLDTNYLADTPVGKDKEELDDDPVPSQCTLNETYDASFLQIFRETNLGEATDFIQQFDIDTKFPMLWNFANSSPFNKIPYTDLTANVVTTKKSPEDYRYDTFYKVTPAELRAFIRNINTSIETLKSLILPPELKSHCVAIEQRLNEIMTVASDLEKQNQTLTLTENDFASLKLSNDFRNKLKKTLEDIERKNLLDFYAHLAFVTLNGGNSNRKLVTQGLEKLRDYLNNRNPRAKKAMGKGQFGVAKFIYDYCEKTLFGTNEQSKIAPYILRMKKGDPISVARDINYGGVHFVCEVLTDAGNFKLDSMSKNKQKVEKETKSHSIAVEVGKDFYDSCTKLSIDTISIPMQKDNNCYLSAGWLTFCAFLHFYTQSIN